MRGDDVPERLAPDDRFGIQFRSAQIERIAPAVEADDVLDRLAHSRFVVDKNRRNAGKLDPDGDHGDGLQGREPFGDFGGAEPVSEGGRQDDEAVETLRVREVEGAVAHLLGLVG